MKPGIMFYNLPRLNTKSSTTKDEFYQAKNSPWFEHVVANNLTVENNFDQCGRVNHQSHMGISNGIQSWDCDETKKKILDILKLVEMKKTSFYSNRIDNPKNNFKSGITYSESFEIPTGEDMYETNFRKYSIDYFSKENFIQACKDKKCFRIYFKK